jgi:PAS domain S-box-containing protein
LIVDDSAADAELLVRHLEREDFFVEHERVDTIDAVRRAFDREPSWDVVVADGHVPGMRLLDTIEVIQSVAPLAPIIVVSGTLDEATAVDVLRAGASDFITKQKLFRLAPAVRREIGQAAERQTTMRMKQEQVELASIVEHSSDAIYSTDRESNIVSWNEAASRLYGFSMDEAIGRKVEALTATSRGFNAEARARVLAGERVPRYDAVRRRKDGTEMHVEITLSPIFDHGGSVSGVGSSVRDLTSERLAASSDAAFRAIFDSAGDAIMISGDDRRCIEANDAACRLFGLAHDELIGRTSEGLSESTIPDSWQTFIEDGVQTGEITVRRPSGEIRTAEYHATANFQEGRHLSILRDVTDRRRAEELELQLHQSQKLESVGRLAGGVAHDFNNILTAILGYSDVALARVPNDQPTLQKAIQEIRSAGERAAGLTQQLLAFSRKQKLEREPLDFNALIAEFAPMLSRLLGEDISVLLELNAAPGWVIADRSQLGQVILNLAVNARDAMPDGGTLRIATSNQQTVAGAETVVLKVSDTGCGIDAETLPTIFEPFFTTKEVGEGTGLGLSTVLGVVEQSGGTISVTSVVREGTTFTVDLPAAAPGTETSERREPARLRAGNESVLLIEDQAQLRELLVDWLAEKGYNVVGASTPAAALQCARDTAQLDLIITDVVMPEMNGRDLVTSLLEIHPDTKVIFMSGYTRDVVIERDVLPTGRHFLQKPFSLSDLEHCVRDTLDEK